MKKQYIPINCSYYDRLEAWATLKTEVSVDYLNEREEPENTKGYIKDLITKEGAEYVLLSDDKLIRLDYLLKINDEPIVLVC